ncbi:F-box/RNI-like/FBD-like domains-containing protein [Striga asiatica]|uniref:F-box/RNI-like/FBD-like domains-containing protein n=1 Tax=Striga asiatica TaxID=4170 RepID=A0A5A7R7L2_STRAF|nr:F-box/RNI-like/FBD-like domains-containing protein [Striga asiatica]
MAVQELPELSCPTTMSSPRVPRLTMDIDGWCCFRRRWRRGCKTLTAAPSKAAASGCATTDGRSVSFRRWRLDRCCFLSVSVVRVGSRIATSGSLEITPAVGDAF